MVFARFAHKRIDICGFVTTKEFAGECIMNRPVLKVSDLDINTNTILVIADECKKDEVMAFWDKGFLGEIISYSECLAVDERLRDKKIVLYGMGAGSKHVKNLLDNIGADVYAYALTKVTEQDIRLADRHVYEITQLSELEGITVIITATANRKQFQWEMLANLETLGIDDIYLNDTLVPDLDISNSITFQQIDKAQKENKKIYIYGRTDEYGKLIKDILDIYSIPCEGYVGENELYDMYYDGMEGRFFIVNAIDQLEIEKKCDELERMNISINDLAYTGLAYVNLKSPCYEIIPDCLVDYAPLYADFNGINVHGDRRAKTRIIVLGGSTSTTRRHRPKCWVEFLYERLQDKIGDVVIYNFANAGNDVVVELLKLLRDGYHVKPNYVISLSGVNNVWRKNLAVNQFHVVSSINWIKYMDPERKFNAGIEIKEDLFEFWIRIQKIIKAVSQIYGAQYLGVLQPMNRGKENKNLYETMMFEDEEAKCGAKSFHDNARDDDFYINLLNIFENEENMYVDTVHYSEKANEIIAQKIGDYMIKNIEAIHK